MQLSLNMRAIVSQRLIPTVEGKRVAAIEILLDSPSVKDLILKGDITLLKETMAASYFEGMQTFDQHIFDLYQAGIVQLQQRHCLFRQPQRYQAQDQDGGDENG